MKRGILILLLAICVLFTVSIVCAGDVNDTAIASEDSNQIELSLNNEITEDNLQTSDGNTALTKTDNDETASADEGTFYDLRVEIGNGGNKSLKKSRYKYTGGNTINISKSGVIDGNGAVIDMAGSTIRAFTVYASGVTFKNLTIQNANPGADGGTIYFNGSGTVSNCNFINNSVTGKNIGGGAIYMHSGTVTNCKFTDNSAYDGGAVYIESGTVENCNFTNNKVNGVFTFGGAVYIESGTVKNSNFRDNEAAGSDGWGGAIWISSGTVDNCNFTNNTAKDAGAIQVSRNCHVTNCNFVNNHAYINAGAIDYLDPGTIENCSFTGNTASSAGGAIRFCEYGKAINCNFTDNRAAGSQGGGGAIYFRSGGDTINCNFINNQAEGNDIFGGGAILMLKGTVKNSNFVNNKAKFGGAICSVCQDYARTTIEDCSFTDNQVTEGVGNGGAIFLASLYDVVDTMGQVINCRFTNNHAKSDGGAIYFHYTGGKVIDCKFTNNSASASGGAILFTSSLHTCSVTNCNFAENSASASGGAVFFKSTGSKSSATNCNFIGNKAISDYGGAIYMYLGNAENCNFTSNSARNGGAIMFANSDTAANCNFVDNVASGDGGAIWMPSGTVEYCNFTNNSADHGGAAYFKNDGAVTNSDFADNHATYGGAAYFNNTGAVTNSNFTKNTASKMGGAVYFNSLGSNANVRNSNFTNNWANGASSSGGAVYFNGNGNVTNCSFRNNDATMNGGAVYFGISDSKHAVTNCNFTNNKAKFDGGAIWTYSLGVENCNFINNSAYSYGGAIRFSEHGTTVNCSFTNNTASIYGGAAYFGSGSTGTVEKCNFTNNNASSDGGAIYFEYGSTGTVEKCNFIDNSAINQGGALYFADASIGTVENCNFTNDASSWSGGAVCFWGEGIVTNCSFANNSASDNGGAIYFYHAGNVTNCYFTNNSARYGGAIEFNGDGTVENCNFAGNIATTGSAIYFYSSSSTKTVSNSILLNNRAKVDDTIPLNVTINENNIEIIFRGQNNLLNAIYSRNDAEVSFTNVTYWGAKGIANTGISTVTPSRSNKEAGQNITIAVVVNDKIVFNDVKVTDENGTIVLDVKVDGNYYISACRDADSYYTEAKNITSNMKFYVNLTSQTTTNWTVNITAKSNIYNEVMPGKLLFVLPDSSEISAAYASNGTWWAVYEFADYGDYIVNASFVGLSNVEITNATVSIKRANSTVNVSDVVLDYGESKNVTVTTEGATGITALIDGNPVDVVNNYTIPISGLAAGNHTLTVTTIADEDHVSVNKTVNITVNRTNSTLTVNNMTFDYDTTGSTVVSFTGAAGITAKITDHDEAVVSVNGNAITVSNLNAGKYTLEVSTIADENHTDVIRTANVTVNKINSTLTVNNMTFDYNTTGSIVVSFTGATGVIAAVNDLYAVVNVTGNRIAVSNLSVGTYVLTVTTLPDENHIEVIKTADITVRKLNPKLIVNDVVLDYGSSTNATVITEGASGITAKIGDVNATVKDNTIIIPVLDAGIYTLSVTAIGDAYYNNVTLNVTVTVNKLKTQMSADAVTTTYNINKNLVITLKDTKGNALSGFKVTLNLNGVKTYVTDKNGQVKINVAKLVPKTYAAKITFDGNKNYKASAANVKVTVKKAKAKITAKKKTFKRKVKTKKYTITLKDNVGKAIKKAKVTIKIKKKTYKATTNAKGKATFKIKKLTKKGTYKATVTYKGNAYYNKATKKVKIKVK